MNRTASVRQKSELNKLQPEDRPAHNWYRFVLSFPPHLVRNYVERFGLTPHHQVLDPFCGTGTTLVECKKLGIPSVGIEANPMACFATDVKTDWDLSPDGLIEHAEMVGESAVKELRDQEIDDECLPLLENGQADGQKTEMVSLRKLPVTVQDLLLKNSISPLPLHKTLVLLEWLRRHANKHYERHERLALAKAIVFSISNLHFGPEVGVGAPKTDAAVIASWLGEVRSMAGHLRRLRGSAVVPARVHSGDSRRITRFLVPDSIDAVITSPPYPNEKDYTRTTRLESVLLGLIRSKMELRALKQRLVRSNTRGVYKHDDDDQWVIWHSEIQRIAKAIEKRRVALGKTSGFERLYHKVTKLYFGGMAKHLDELRQVLRPGAQLAYVVGDQASYLRVLIRTGRLLADIAQSLGYEVVAIELFRTRLATATKAQLREEVLVLRWPGKQTSRPLAGSSRARA